MDADEVIKLLSTRTSIVDPRYFMDRSLELRRLASARVAWIFGPGRIGKSSLARRLCAEAGKAAIVIWVDASDLTAGDFEKLLSRALERAPGDLIKSGGSVRDRFASLVESSTLKSLRIVFDEFDVLALHLGLEEQTYLRKLAHEHESFSLIITTRFDPARLVEEFSAPASRLLGISMQQLLPALEKTYINKLFTRIAEDLERPAFANWASLVWERVGGHPISVMTLAHALVCQEIDQALDEDTVLDTLDRHHGEISQQLSSLWRDLRLETRSFLLANPEDARPEDRRSAKLEGYCSNHGDVRPRWLVEVGRERGIVATPTSTGQESTAIWTRAGRLDELVYSINTKVKRRVGKDFFEATNEVNQRYYLTRGNGTEQEFNNAVGHLHKRLYESARIPDSPEPGGRQRTKWKIDDEVTKVWRQSRGLRWICALRNHAGHDQNRNYSPSQINKDFMNVGDIFTELCGTPAPTRPEQWLSARSALLDMVIRDLEEMYNAAEISPLLGAPQGALSEGGKR